MPCLRQSRPRKVTGRNKHSFCRSAQSSPEIVNIGASHRVSPSLHLRLDVRPAKEIVALNHEGIDIYSPSPEARVTETFTNPFRSSRDLMKCSKSYGLNWNSRALTASSSKGVVPSTSG